MIRVTINGHEETVERGALLSEILQRAGTAHDATGIAVAVNDTVVPRSEWTTKRMHDSDVVEIIRAVQGG